MGKIKKIFLIILFIFCIIFIVACNNLNSTKEIPETTSGVLDYVDPETGVHYLIYSAGYQGGITVRYNADGTIMVDSVIGEEEE